MTDGITGQWRHIQMDKPKAKCNNKIGKEQSSLFQVTLCMLGTFSCFMSSADIF